MTKKQLALTILSILFIMAMIFTAVRQQANADTAEPGQHRAVMFLPVLFQQCRIGENCAVVVPTPSNPCDAQQDWPYCP